MKLYHSPGARSSRVVWLLEELGDVPCDIEPVEMVFPDSRPYAQPTPSGKVPTLVDGDVAVFESGAILQYILERYGNGRLEPARDTPAYARYLHWMHFAEAGLGASLNAAAWLGFKNGGEGRMAAAVEEFKLQASEAMALIDKRLAESAFLVGDDFTAADIMVGYCIGFAEFMKAGPAEGSRVADWAARLKARPAYKKAFQKA